MVRSVQVFMVSGLAQNLHYSGIQSQPCTYINAFLTDFPVGSVRVNSNNFEKSSQVTIVDLSDFFSKYSMLLWHVNPKI